MQWLLTQMLLTLSVHGQNNDQEIVKRTTNPRCFDCSAVLVSEGGNKTEWMECFNPYSKTTTCSNKFGCEVYLETSKRDDQLEPEKRLIRRSGYLRLRRVRTSKFFIKRRDLNRMFQSSITPKRCLTFDERASLRRSYCLSKVEKLLGDEGVYQKVCY